MKFLLLLFIPLNLFGQDKNWNGSAAITFINSLDSSQKSKCVFEFDQTTRYDWHFFPATMIPRTGVPLRELDSIQKRNFYTFFKPFLSDKGFTRTKEIMGYEYLLKEMEPANPNRIPENYFVSIYGSPGTDSVWGWKFTGHHVSLNFTIVNGRLAFAPFFFGIYPGEVKEGVKKGNRVLKDEEDLGFELVNSLNKEQKSQAIFQLRAFTEIVTTNAITVAPLDRVGIFARNLTAAQKTLLNKLIVAYLSTMPDGIANIRMRKIASEEMNEINFGWAGALSPGEPHYYRIQGKTFLIEFDNTQANANHIHTVWRDFNGDFGIDLLREHYQHSEHHHK